MQRAAESLVGVREAARMLSVSTDTVRRYVRQHRLRSERTPGGQLRFRVSQIKRFS